MKILIFTLLTIGVCTVLALYSPAAALQPGTLSPSHESMNNSCFKCHDAFQGVAVAKCIACHNPDEIGLSRGLAVPGFHQALTNVDCMSCHWLHADAESWHKIQPFKHDFLQASLLNNCVQCHANSRPADNLHQTAGNDCGSCHSTHAWRDAAFDHSKYFRLDSRHNVACNICHTVPSDYSTYSCVACHKNGIPDD